MTVEGTHTCTSCGHGADSIEALRARLDRFEIAEAGDDVTLEAWRRYFDAVCRAVADATNLDVFALASILEGLIVLAGEAHAKGAVMGGAALARTKRDGQPGLRIVKR